MQPSIKLWIILLSLVFLSACTASNKSGSINIIDDTETLDKQRISNAATPLLSHAANLVIIIEQNGTDTALPSLEQLAMISDGSIVSRGIAIYISMNPRYSELRVGEPWSDSLPSEQLREIRLNTLNPALQANNPTAGVESSLVALNSSLEKYEAGRQRTSQIISIVVGAIVLFILGTILWPRIAYGPIGQKLEQLWEKTPPGQAQLRKRIHAQIVSWHSSIKAIRQRANSSLAGPPNNHSHLQAELDALDRRHQTLEQQPDSASLVVELHTLHQDYETWIRKVGDIGREERDLTSAAKLSHSLLNRLERSFEHAQNPDRNSKKKQSSKIKEEHRLRLVELRASYTGLEQEWKSRPDHELTDQEGQSRKQLLTRFSDLNNQLHLLWQLALPQAFAQYQRELIQNTAYTYSDSSSTSDSSWSSSSDSTSDTSWSSASDTSSSSSSDSSDGGSW